MNVITVIVDVRVKEQLLDQYLEIAQLLTRKFRGRPGCINYSFHQSVQNLTEFVLFQQWETHADIDSHYEALVALIGPAKSGQVLPERLTNMHERAEPRLYVSI